MDALPRAPFGLRPALGVGYLCVVNMTLSLPYNYSPLNRVAIKVFRNGQV
jgi:hypothetical protein